MTLKRNNIGLLLILATSVLSIVLVLNHGPIPQDRSYHAFIDQRMVFGIPNFYNVISNLPFLIVGIMGYIWISQSSSEAYNPDLKYSYVSLFASLALVALGSGYYHLRPCNETLVWDRLPMALGFMALFSIIIGEFISTRYSLLLLVTLVSIGLYSVLYWYFSETQNNGDLRLYLIVQFLPILLIPIILTCYRPSFTSSRGYWLLLSCYLIAKVFETYDSEVFNYFRLISGHTLKHIIAAVGLFNLINSFKKRTRKCQYGLTNEKRSR